MKGFEKYLKKGYHQISEEKGGDNPWLNKSYLRYLI